MQQALSLLTVWLCRTALLQGEYDGKIRVNSFGLTPTNRTLQFMQRRKKIDKYRHSTYIIAEMWLHSPKQEER